MGDYTRLTVGVSLKPDLPVGVVEVLKYLTTVDGDICLDGLGVKDDPFFSSPNWATIFYVCCVYLPATVKPWFDQQPDCCRLVASGSFKNYDDEAEKFLNWLRPYMLGTMGDEVAYTEFDLDKSPKVTYRLKEGGFDKKIEILNDGWLYGI